MLGFAGAKVLVVPKVFRGFDHAAMAHGLQRELPEAAARGRRRRRGRRQLRARAAVGQPARRAGTQPPRLAPDAMAVVMFTSGTTGSPKGVMHSHNTLLACNRALAGRFGLTGGDVSCWPARRSAT
jgi:cyclohexanecarboxylate-CoA ligase